MDKTFKTFHRVFSFGGVHIYSKKKWNHKLGLIQQIFNFLCAFAIFIFTTGFLFNSFSDIVVLIEGASIWSTGVILFISLGVCLVFRSKFRYFLEEMAFKDEILSIPFVEHVMKTQYEGKLKELKVMIVTSHEKLLKYTRWILMVYVSCVWVTATMYICDSIYRFTMREDDNFRPLAFDMWFPWSLQDFKVYIASFIFHAYSGYLCIAAYPGLQSTIILLIGQTIRNLKILTFILENLDELVLEMTKRRNEQWQTYCSAVLSQCVDHYIKIKKFSNRLNVICQPFYLALILDAMILVCVCSVRIAITANKASLELMKYYLHGFCFVVIVFLFCCVGQQVQNQCEVLEKAVTEKWYIFSRKHKKDVCIFEMALSQRMPIYIFGSIPLSLPTFTWFLKTGMSFFTLLTSVIDIEK